MKLLSTGVIFDEYVSASPDGILSGFIDRDGAVLWIPTATLIKMYELVRFDLERKGGWASVMMQCERDGGKI
jgi:hypothetical protein